MSTNRFRYMKAVLALLRPIKEPVLALLLVTTLWLTKSSPTPETITGGIGQFLGAWMIVAAVAWILRIGQKKKGTK